MLAAAACLSFASAADARPINDRGMTIEEVSAWVKSAGFEPKIEKTDGGERYVTTSTQQGVKFDVDLYDCDQGRCRALQFTASFDVKSPLPLSKANEWNRGKRYIRMYLTNDGDPAFQYDANVAPGGTYEALQDDLDVFIQFVPEMLEHIGWED